MRLIFILSTILFYNIDHTLADDDNPVSYRLLAHQRPQKYTLNLEFKKDVFEGTSTGFKGSLTINFLVSRTVNYIQFHCPVAITSKEFIENESIPVPIEFESYDPVTHIYTITTKGNLNYTYNYTLNMEYFAVIETSSSKGVYRSSYVDEDGYKQYFIATHFRPTYARFAFPSFDEPKMKASFSISITYPKDMTALSNAVQIGGTDEIDDDYEKVTFKETPIMSTYLVGFIICKLSCTQRDNITNGIPYRVCSRKANEGERSLALDMGPPFIERLENITVLNYSDHLLGKMDQIAIPDYSEKYTENWGLITYREPSLLWNSRESSIAYRNVVMDIFLELAHSWFGNLESAEWWDYEFLNLGFARFYQYHANVTLLREWELEKQFVIDQLQVSMELDALSSTSPLSNSVESPTEILTKFNTISYGKGASIIRMAQHIMGHENFQKGIRYFLPIYNGSTIMPIYVWNKLEVFIPRELLPKTKNLNGAMENWTEKAGFPLVTVTARGKDVILTQKRFLYSGEEDFTEWCIPITYTASEDFDKFENTTTKEWLMPETSTTLYDVLKENKWIILNNQQVGYYRINYDDTLWGKIKAILFTEHTSINVLNRAQIVDDLLNLARARILNYSYVFDILKYLKNETDYYPWYSAITNFNYLLTHLDGDSVLSAEISSMILELLDVTYQTLSFDDVDPENQIYVLKFVAVSTLACKLGEESCVSNVKNLFEKYKKGASIDKNLRGLVYCNALRYSNDSDTDWNFLWNDFQSEILESERENLIAALGCTKEDSVLKYYLDQSLNSSTGLKLKDLPKVWYAVYSSNTEGVDAAFDFIYNNYSKLSSYYSSAASLLISVIDRFTRNDQLQKLERLIAAESLDPSIRVVAQTASKTARERIEWATYVEDDLLSYFDDSTTATDDIISTTPSISSKIESSFAELIVFVVSCRAYNALFKY